MRRRSIGICSGAQESGQKFIAMTGKQWFMEMEGEYRFTWCWDGRFHEIFKGDNVTVEWGYNGKHSWYADFAGRVTKLQLDSQELCLLSAWVRNGYWLTEKGLNKLNISHRTEAGDLPVVRNSRMQILDVKMKEFDKVVCVVVDMESWLPLRLVARVAGQIESWGYSDWQTIEFSENASVRVPQSVSHATDAGPVDSIFTSEFETISEQKGRSLCERPCSSFIPRDNVYPSAEFDTTVSPHVTMFQSENGHSFIRPLVDGQSIGFFLLDTGASGLTIDYEKAKSLSMEGFGAVYLLGVESLVKSRFVRGKEIQLGPLKISNPVYIETTIRGVFNTQEPIVGVCGFDLFFHCIVEMSMGKGLLSLFDPASYVSSLSLQWEDIILMDNLPYIPAKINDIQALMLLDTGAAGADVILHGRTAQRYLRSQTDVLERFRSNTVDELSTKNGLLAGAKEIDSLEVAGLVFEKLLALLVPQKVGNLDVSVYTAGLLCGRLLTACSIVLDYQNSRFALRR